MAGTNSKGARVAYHLTENTAFTAIAAGASLPSGWVQVLNVQEVDTVPNTIEDYDDGDLEDQVEVPAQTVKPGKMTFTKKKNSQSVTLRAMVDGSTKNAWVVVWDDGTTEWAGSARLKCPSAGRASNGDLKAKVLEQWEIVNDTVLTSATNG